MPEDTTKTFFSYAREDSEFVLRLVQDLRATGAAVWLDQLDIGPGEHWDTEVERALRDCPRHVTVLSPDSVASPNVMDEVSYALEEHKHVIPLLYRECTVPFRLRRIQYIDFREYTGGLRELLKALDVNLHPSLHPPASAQPVPVSSSPAPVAVELVPEVVAQAERPTEPEDRPLAPVAVAPTLRVREGALVESRMLPSDQSKASSTQRHRNMKRWIPAVLVVLAWGLLWFCAAPRFNAAGNTSSLKGDLNGAISYYNVALTIRPDYAEAYYGRGNAFKRKREYNLAIKDYDKYLQLKPKDAFIYFLRGDAYLDKGDNESAIFDYSEGLALGADWDFAHTNRGIAYTRKGDYDQAIRDFSYVLSHSRDASAYNSRATAYEQAGRFTEALQDLELALQLDPSNLTFKANRDRVAGKLRQN